MKMKVRHSRVSVIVCHAHHALQPKAVSETEEHDLAQLMAKAGQENAEVSGDEDDEELV